MSYLSKPPRPSGITLASHSINDSCTGFWPLTDGYGAIIGDISGLGNNGVRQEDAEFKNSDIGHVLGGPEGAYVGPSGNNFNGTSFSVSIWMLTDETSSSRSKWLWGHWDNNAGSLAMMNERHRLFLFHDSGSSLFANNAILPNTWHNVVTTYDGTTARIYIDGVLLSSDNRSFGARGNQPLYIGQKDSASSTSFDGALQNFRTWDRVLSQGEIRELYRRPWAGTDFDPLWLSPPANPSLSSSPEAASMLSSCVGWWPLAEGSGSTATDLVGPNNGTITNGAWAAETVGTAADLGTTSSISGTGVNVSTAATFSLWYKDSGGTTSGSMLFSLPRSAGGADGVNIQNRGTGVRFTVYSTTTNALSSATATFSINDGDWHHITGTYDGANIRLYIDGAQLATNTQSGTIGHLANGEFNINALSSGTSGFSCDGFYHNVRVFSSALTADQVRILHERPWIGAEYNESDPLTPPVPANITLDPVTVDESAINVGQIGWWPMDEGSGALVRDIVGSRHGTNASQVEWQLDEQGISTIYPSIAGQRTETTLDLAGSSAVTVSAWIRNDGSSAGNSFGKIVSQSHSGSFDTYMGKSSNAALALDINSTVVTANNSDIPPIGTWFHVCFIWEQGVRQEVYINGVLSNSVVGDGSVIGSTSHGVMFGGTSDVVGNRPWDGGIQNVRIWNRALLGEEVFEIYTRPFVGSSLDQGYPSVNSGLAAWWPLTETDDFASGASDIAGNSNDGTKSGGVTSDSLLLGNCARFDNTGHIDVGKSFWDGGVASTKSFTFNSWFSVDNTSADHGLFGAWNSASEALNVWVDVGGASLSLTAICGDGSTQTITSVDAPVVSVNQWHMGTVVFDGDADTLSVYLDGINGVTSSATANLTSAPMNFHIGDDGSSARTLEGLMQNCRLWSRPLGSLEILQLYHSPWSGSSYPAAEAEPEGYFLPARFNRLGSSPRFRRL